MPEVFMCFVVVVTATAIFAVNVLKIFNVEEEAENKEI